MIVNSNLETKVIIFTGDINIAINNQPDPVDPFKLAYATAFNAWLDLLGKLVGFWRLFV